MARLSIKRFVCCGMDVHKKFVVAAIAYKDYRGVTTYNKKRFATFNPDLRALRELFRYRQKLIGHRSSEKNRFQNALTVSNIALSAVLSDTFGKSATAIVDYILTCGTFDPEHCKSLLLKKPGIKRMMW